MWRPTAGLEALRRRAEVLAEIRAFFAEAGVLEVETPLLGAATASDLHIQSIVATVGGRRGYLQTSPEYAMKRLLAAGSGPIYQISKAFRDGEQGRRHNPEFTLLEWYRPGWDHHRLMDEVAALLSRILSVPPAERQTYREAVREHAGVDPWTASAQELRRRAQELGLGEVSGLDADDRGGWLDLLLSLVVEPQLGRRRPTLLYDYPPDQAALARVRGQGEDAVAERFEAYVEGVELANGYHELLDPAEQRRRFERDLDRRAEAGLPPVPVDERLLAALEAGLPPCAGVALGVDRLVMLAAGASSLQEVLAFPADRA
ncbi:MAG: EF-P lysine aminoacylase EpmA [Acidobacteriota bacterium]|nr:EF-P lysine aminoacylase EpmA [Acidobacteriota bacterium]